MADGDRTRLQESLAGSFMRATDQDMGFGGGSVGLRQPNQAPPPSGGIIAAPPAAAASQAAAAFLSSVGGRFASGGTLQPEPTGLHTPDSTAATPPDKVCTHHVMTEVVERLWCNLHALAPCRTQDLSLGQAARLC